ncbi:MAG: trypsin-like peptidase domain-containing protein [Clostridia bacterium]|nr:trypsin-like peptidase domain-containing protein [Clostridia bacterium]
MNEENKIIGEEIPEETTEETAEIAEEAVEEVKAEEVKEDTATGRVIEYVAEEEPEHKPEAVPVAPPVIPVKAAEQETHQEENTAAAEAVTDKAEETGEEASAPAAEPVVNNEPQSPVYPQYNQGAQEYNPQYNQPVNPTGQQNPQAYYQPVQSQQVPQGFQPTQGNPQYYNPYTGNFVPPQGFQPTQGAMPPQGFQPVQGVPPYQMPVPQKQKTHFGAKFFIFIMILLLVFSIGSFGASIYFYNATRDFAVPQEQTDKETENSEDENSDTEGAEESTEESTVPQDEDNAETENSQPDIKYEPYTDGIKINSRPKGEELNAQQVYEKVLPSTVTIKATVTDSEGNSADGYGTGIFITEDGFIITNSHVISNTKSTKVTITTSDGTEHDCVTVGFDKTTDIAILKIDGNGYTAAELGDADELAIGEWVIAIGNPGGEGFSGSLTRGVISGLDRLVGVYSSNGMTYIQTDAAINPGNSGGPLVNMYGQVVGINSSKIIADYYEGMGFAIPISKAKGIIDQLLSTGYIPGRVRLGIVGQTSTAWTYGAAGVRIVTINEDSCFMGTEAQEEDIITAIGEEEVTSLDTLANAMLSYSPGDTAKITLFRPETGEELTVEVTLIVDEGETQK